MSGVPVGAVVRVTLDVDRTAATRIEASGSSVFSSVKAVDADQGTITVASHPNDRVYPADRTFKVARDTVIRIDEKPGRLADIPVGSSLHALNLRVDQQTADSINAYGPGYQHVGLKAADAGKRTITVDDQGPPQLAGKTLAVAGDAAIKIDGKPGQLAGVPAGSFVNLGLAVDCRTARSLDVEGPCLGGCGGSTVKAVSLGTNTITFDDRAAADVAGKTFTVAKDAWIQIDDRPGKLDGIPVGAMLNVTLTVDGQTVRCIRAQGRRLVGILKTVDAGNSTITVDAATFSVARDALIVIHGRENPLAGLPLGANVIVNFRVDQKTVGMIQTSGP